jgi:hypothetical protein
MPILNEIAGHNDSHWVYFILLGCARPYLERSRYKTRQDKGDVVMGGWVMNEYNSRYKRLFVQSHLGQLVD